MRRLTLLIPLALAMALSFPVTAGAQTKQTVLKVATLAPAKSTWTQHLNRLARQVERQTDGAVAMRIYDSGVMGDEPAVVRKMRTGQLDGAALTNIGLSAIDPRVLVLQLPLIFRNDAELDYVRNQMDDQLRGYIRERGFELVQWADVGFVYYFTKTPVRSVEDVRKTRPWVWDAAPMLKAVVDEIGVYGVPLDATSVMSSLRTGVIDAFLSAPYAAVATRWYEEAEYVTNLKLAVTIGGLVFTESALASLTPQQREVLAKLARELEESLQEEIRADNARAIQTIQKNGVESVAPASIEGWQRMAAQTRESLVGEMIPEKLVNEMLAHLERYRAQKAER